MGARWASGRARSCLRENQGRHGSICSRNGRNPIAADELLEPTAAASELPLNSPGHRPVGPDHQSEGGQERCFRAGSSRRRQEAMPQPNMGPKRIVDLAAARLSTTPSAPSSCASCWRLLRVPGFAVRPLSARTLLPALLPPQLNFGLETSTASVPVDLRYGLRPRIPRGARHRREVRRNAAAERQDRCLCCSPLPPGAPATDTSSARLRALSKPGPHACFAHWIYEIASSFNNFLAPVLFGLLPYSSSFHSRSPKTYPPQATALWPAAKRPDPGRSQGLQRSSSGDGIGIQVESHKTLLRIPREAENTHILIVGDTGPASRRSFGRCSVRSQSARRQRYRLRPGLRVRRASSTRPIAATSFSIRSTNGAPTGVHPRSCSRKREAKAMAVSLFQPAGNTTSSLSKAHRKSSPICSPICPRRQIWFTGCRTRKRSTAASRAPNCRADRPEGPAAANRRAWLPQYGGRQLPPAADRS